MQCGNGILVPWLGNCEHFQGVTEHGVAKCRTQLNWTELSMSVGLCCSVLRHSVMSNSLWPHGLQHARLPYPSLSPRVCSNSCPLSQWCHLTISSFVVPSPPAFNLSQHQGLFQRVSSWHQVAKILEISFSISPSNEYSGLISFKIDWLDLLSVQWTLKSLLQFSHSVLSDSLQPHEPQHTRPPCPS